MWRQGYIGEEEEGREVMSDIKEKDEKVNKELVI